jgi:hypothetical protein
VLKENVFTLMSRIENHEEERKGIVLKFIFMCSCSRKSRIAKRAQ